MNGKGNIIEGKLKMGLNFKLLIQSFYLSEKQKELLETLYFIKISHL